MRYLLIFFFVFTIISHAQMHGRFVVSINESKTEVTCKVQIKGETTYQVSSADVRFTFNNSSWNHEDSDAIGAFSGFMDVHNTVGNEVRSAMLSLSNATTDTNWNDITIYHFTLRDTLATCPFTFTMTFFSDENGDNIPIGTFENYTVDDDTCCLPVEMGILETKILDSGVELLWETITEVNNYGFEIQRSDDLQNWKTIGFVSGMGNSNSPKSYRYTDAYSGAGLIYYRLKQIDYEGEFEYFLFSELDIPVPNNYQLLNNFPNPFNPSTTISYVIPTESNVTISVYNQLGEIVDVLSSGIKSAGTHNLTFHAEGKPSGMYVCRIRANSVDGNTVFEDSMKMILMK